MTADLGSLTLGSLTLDPDFDASVTEYAATTGNASDDLTITLAADSASAVVTLGGVAVDPSEGVYTLTWGEDPNEVETTVTDTGYAGEVSKTYTVTVTAPLTDAGDADADSSGSLTQEELEALTVAQLKQLAASLNITLTATRKAEIIAELLGDNEALDISGGDDT